MGLLAGIFYMFYLSVFTIVARKTGNRTSSRHHRNETVKEVERVMGAGGVLRMILHGECREFFMPHALQAAVVQIYMGQLHLVRVQALQVHAKTMVLRSDFYTACFQVFHRLVGAPVTEF
jgi:hypothetical protein